MTTSEAKKDLTKRLAADGITFTKLTARTVSFQGFGFGTSIFVAIHGGVFPPGKNTKTIAGIPKPSEGGYIPEPGDHCTFQQ